MAAGAVERVSIRDDSPPSADVHGKPVHRVPPLLRRRTTLVSAKPTSRGLRYDSAKGRSCFELRNMGIFAFRITRE
jgi:hypothetical protein